MANVLRPLLDAEDERAFLRFLAQTPYEVYPRRVPPDWKPFLAAPETLRPASARALPRGGRPRSGAGGPGEARAGQGALAGRRGALTGRLLGALAARRGRALLVSGELWAELDVTPQTGRRDAAPDRFRRRFAELEDWLKKTCRRSEPVGWLIGPSAARRAREGLVLRAAGHRGEVLRPFR